MRVLLTGGRSLLGAAAADLLAARGDEVTVFQRRPAGTGHREVLGDIADPVAVRAAVAGQQAVLHLAAKVGVSGPLAEFVRTNVTGTQVLLEAARAEPGLRTLVHVSSPSVAHTGRSLVGVGAGPADPARARGRYARTKAAAELLALAADGPDLAVAVIRPHLVWGPGDTQLIGRIADRARAGRLPIIGAGTALIDTTYLTNAADALVAALDRIEAARGQPLVVTNGEPRPVGELIADICRAVGAPPPTVRLPTGVAWAAGLVVEGAMAAARRVPGPPRIVEPPLTRFLVEQLSTAHWFDQRQTRALLGWRPRVSLAEGLSRLTWHPGRPVPTTAGPARRPRDKLVAG